MPYRKVGYAELCFYIIRAKLKEVFHLPSKPRVPCKHPGCAALVPVGTKYCDEHKSLHPEENRSASSRGYGKTWQRESKRFLRSHPLCELCASRGRYVKATVVDHKTPHRGDARLFWDQTNWQALCKACHDHKTAVEDEHPVYHY